MACVGVVVVLDVDVGVVVVLDADVGVVVVLDADVGAGESQSQSKDTKTYTNQTVAQYLSVPCV